MSICMPSASKLATVSACWGWRKLSVARLRKIGAMPAPLSADSPNIDAVNNALRR